MEFQETGYQEVQHSAWVWLLFPVSAFQVSAPMLIKMPTSTAAALFAAGILVMLLAFSFAKLSVYDTGFGLRVQFGPLQIFGTEVDYQQIRSIARERTSLLDGWGLRRCRGGWLYNVWGFDCIKVQLDEKVVRIGTQRPEELLQFLEEQAARAKT